MTKVKICGITNMEDARHAVECGADELGFNFYPKSPRCISADRAGDIASRVPSHVLKVGVFVNESRKQILKTAKDAGLDAIQLHGDEDLKFVSDLFKNSGLLVIKAVRPQTYYDAMDALDIDAHAILVDAFSTSEYGGTGLKANWERASEIWTFNSMIYLAGGLVPSNVADAIQAVHPYAVDVASGVESSPGKKDPPKVEAFIEAVRKTAISY
ncbi:MAG TPA: phosphoribosylanthranilate isomerase [Pyrinomonadaceae bacterium]|nr:phosphoribosylanthranilate isomerase [Pyrinomonadaceae bacterium]